MQATFTYIPSDTGVSKSTIYSESKNYNVLKISKPGIGFPNCPCTF